MSTTVTRELVSSLVDAFPRISLDPRTARILPDARIAGWQLLRTADVPRGVAGPLVSALCRNFSPDIDSINDTGLTREELLKVLSATLRNLFEACDDSCPDECLAHQPVGVIWAQDVLIRLLLDAAESGAENPDLMKYIEVAVSGPCTTLWDMLDELSLPDAVISTLLDSVLASHADDPSGRLAAFLSGNLATQPSHTTFLSAVAAAGRHSIPVDINALLDLHTQLGGSAAMHKERAEAVVGALGSNSDVAAITALADSLAGVQISNSSLTLLCHAVGSLEGVDRNLIDAAYAAVGRCAVRGGSNRMRATLRAARWYTTHSPLHLLLPVLDADDTVTAEVVSLYVDSPVSRGVTFAHPDAEHLVDRLCARKRYRMTARRFARAAAASPADAKLFSDALAGRWRHLKAQQLARSVSSVPQVLEVAKDPELLQSSLDRVVAFLSERVSEPRPQNGVFETAALVGERFELQRTDLIKFLMSSLRCDNYVFPAAWAAGHLRGFRPTLEDGEAVLATSGFQDVPSMLCVIFEGPLCEANREMILGTPGFPAALLDNAGSYGVDLFSSLFTPQQMGLALELSQNPEANFDDVTALVSVATKGLW